MGSELLEIYFYMSRSKCIFYAKRIMLATILILDSVDIQSVTLLHKPLYYKLNNFLFSL